MLTVTDSLFLAVLLILASQRIESVIGGLIWGNVEPKDDNVPTKRGAPPSIVEWFILSWVSGKWFNYLFMHFSAPFSSRAPQSATREKIPVDYMNLVDARTEYIFIISLGFKVREVCVWLLVEKCCHKAECVNKS